jgi:hypothetical protein
MKFGHTEHSIQNWIHERAMLKNHYGIIPNIFLYGWESDMLSITRSKYVHEYEIKISKTDFIADLKKDKHKILLTGLFESWNGSLESANRPNYFWYVCPEGVIPVSKVPEYAGLIYSGGTYYRDVVKKARKLHSITISEDLVNKINAAYQYRYWNLRRNISNGNEVLEDGIGSLG